MSFFLQSLILRVVVVLALLLAIVLATLLYGHGMMRSPDRIRFIGDIVGVALTRWWKGEDAATERREQLMKPERVRRIGKQYAWAGLLLLAVVLLCLILDMIRIYILLGNQP